MPEEQNFSAEGANEVPTEVLARKVREADLNEEQQFVLMDLVDAVGALRRRVADLENK